jgi:hypothetical protein
MPTDILPTETDGNKLAAPLLLLLLLLALFEVGTARSRPYSRWMSALPG